MTAESQRNDYTLNFALDGRRIGFAGKTVLEALTLTEALLKPGQEVTLSENGVPLGRLIYTPEGRCALSAIEAKAQELC